MINVITASIVKHARDGETIRHLAKNIGFAYSAVYRWVAVLEEYDVLHIIRKGNKNIIKINKNQIYQRYFELSNAIDVVEKDKVFWGIVKKTNLRIRFVQSTAVVIWTHGSYVTGDFADRIYFLEVSRRDMDSLKEALTKRGIVYTEDKLTEDRPLIRIIPKETFNVERKNNVPVMPLNELVSWCKRLYLDSILEQLDEMYHLNIKASYAEIRTNR